MMKKIKWIATLLLVSAMVLVGCNNDSDDDDNTVTITLELDGGTTTTVLKDGKLTGKAGDKLVIDDPTKDGYKFKGWEPPLPSNSLFPSEDTTYKALWETVTNPEGNGTDNDGNGQGGSVDNPSNGGNNQGGNGSNSSNGGSNQGGNGSNTSDGENSQDGSGSNSSNGGNNQGSSGSNSDTELFTPKNEPLYLRGSMNGWDKTDIKKVEGEENTYTVKFTAPAGEKSQFAIATGDGSWSTSYRFDKSGENLVSYEISDITGSVAKDLYHGSDLRNATIATVAGEEYTLTIVDRQSEDPPYLSVTVFGKAPDVKPDVYATITGMNEPVQIDREIGDIYVYALEGDDLASAGTSMVITKISYGTDEYAASTASTVEVDTALDLVKDGTGAITIPIDLAAYKSYKFTVDATDGNLKFFVSAVHKGMYIVGEIIDETARNTAGEPYKIEEAGSNKFLLMEEYLDGYYAYTFNYKYDDMHVWSNWDGSNDTDFMAFKILPAPGDWSNAYFEGTDLTLNAAFVASATENSSNSIVKGTKPADGFYTVVVKAEKDATTNAIVSCEARIISGKIALDGLKFDAWGRSSTTPGDIRPFTGYVVYDTIIAVAEAEDGCPVWTVTGNIADAETKYIDFALHGGVKSDWDIRYENGSNVAMTAGTYVDLNAREDCGNDRIYVENPTVGAITFTIKADSNGIISIKYAQ